MSTAVSIALLAVAISLFAVFSNVRSKKTAVSKRQRDSDGGTTMMASDGGSGCSPGNAGGSDAGCGGDGGGGGD
jgi:hypothetical protein